MYVVVVSMEIKPEHRQDIIKAALQNAHDSCLNEPGTRRIELVEDESNPNHFYEIAAFEDKAASEAHGNGPYVQAFAAAFADYVAQKPTWLGWGTLASLSETP